MKRLSRADILIMFGYTAGTKLYNLLYSSCANFCCIVKNCLGISSGGDAGLVLNQQGDWITAGGGGSQNLSSVLSVGNASGANDINFDTLQGLYFANTSRLREGTIDAGLGGTKGIAQICAVGYELKWEAGRLYVMDGNGTGIRQSLYNLITSPTVNDDNTKGYGIGSLWTLDDNTTYVCTAATTGAAVWELYSFDRITLEFMSGLLTTTIYAFANFKINSVEDVLNTPSTTILQNGNPYTLGNPIAKGDTLQIDVNIASVINLNIQYA
jgi:hypothetical protein